MFPDAPTLRGARHMLELVEAKKSGFGAGVLFWFKWTVFIVLPQMI